MADRTIASADPAAHPESCRNCGYSFEALAPAPKFCPHCGQDTHPHPPAAWEFIHEFITHYVALEGKLWKTLWTLFAKPGSLTRAFSEGKKLRYVHPLRLYITASFVFFIVVKVAGFGHLVEVNTESKPSVAVGLEWSMPVPPNSAPESRGGVPAEVLSQSPQVDFGCRPSDELCRSVESHIKKKWVGKTNADVVAALKLAVMTNLPYALFFMLPVFATMTYWLYWRRGLTYGEHMVYALHVHAFSFFVLLAKSTLPRTVGDVVILISLIWYFVAMQRYFGGRWWVTLLRYGVVATIYPLLLTMLTGAVILVAVAL